MDALPSKMRVLSVMTLIFLGSSCVDAQRKLAPIPDTRGREFIFAFPSNYDIPDALIVQIGGLSTGDTKVDVTVPALNFEQSLTIANTTVSRVDIPVQAVCVGNNFQNTTVLVRSSKDVNVQAINAKAKSVDGFLVLPSDVLGTEYIIPSYTTVGTEKSQFTVTAKSNLTTVTIVSEQELTYGSRLYAPGQEVIFALQRGQTIQFQSGTDLSGTSITSDKPIAVLSGSTCAVVPQKTSRCDHMVEMIPPVDTWGKRFSLQPLMDRGAGYIFRLYAARANTVVKVSGATVQIQRQGQFMEFNQLAEFPLGINADKPILLVQYAKGMQSDGVGDPFMVIIPPIEQYFNGLVSFATFDQSGTTNLSSYAAISVTSPALFTLSLNDVTVLAEEPDISVNGGMFSFGADRTVPLTTGSHVVANFMPAGFFNVILYGFGPGMAYGLPTGFNLRPLTCSSRDPQTGAVREFDCPILQEPLEGPNARAQAGNCPPGMPGCSGSIVPCMPGQPCWPGQTPWIPGAARNPSQTWIPIPNRPPPEPLPDGVAGGNVPGNLAPPPPPPRFPGQPAMPRALLPPNQQRALREFDCPIQQEVLEGPNARAQANCPPGLPRCGGVISRCMPGEPCWPGQTPWIPGAAQNPSMTWIPLPIPNPPDPLPDGVAGGNVPYNLAPPPPPPLFPGQPAIPRALLPPDQQTCFPVTGIIAASTAPSVAVFLFMLVLIFAILYSRYPWIPPRLRKS